MRFSQAALSPRRMKSLVKNPVLANCREKLLSHICKKAAAHRQFHTTHWLQPVFSAIKISFCVPPTHRTCLYLCMSPDSDIITLLAFPRSHILASAARHPAQWPFEQSSLITVAGPCRIFTCFHLSSKAAPQGALRRTQNLLFNLLYNYIT